MSGRGKNGKGPQGPELPNPFLSPTRPTIIRIEPARRIGELDVAPEVRIGKKKKKMHDPGPALRALGADSDALNFIVGVLKGTERAVSVDRFGQPVELTPGFAEKFKAAEFVAKYLWAPLPKQLEVTGADGGPIQTERLQHVPVETLRDVWRKLGATPDEIDAQLVEEDEQAEG